jgi:hypothetical protein
VIDDKFVSLYPIRLIPENRFFRFLHDFLDRFLIHNHVFHGFSKIPLLLRITSAIPKVVNAYKNILLDNLSWLSNLLYNWWIIRFAVP